MVAKEEAERDFGEQVYTVPYGRLPSFCLFNRSMSAETLALMPKIAIYLVEVDLSNYKINLTGVFEQLFTKPAKSRRTVRHFGVRVVSREYPRFETLASPYQLFSEISTIRRQLHPQFDVYWSIGDLSGSPACGMRAELPQSLRCLKTRSTAKQSYSPAQIGRDLFSLLVKYPDKLFPHWALSS